jgi:hypothetical protein
MERHFIRAPNKIKPFSVQYFVFCLPSFLGLDCEKIASVLDCGEFVHFVIGDRVNIWPHRCGWWLVAGGRPYGRLVAAVGAATRPDGWWDPARHLARCGARRPRPLCLFSFLGSLVSIPAKIPQRSAGMADFFTVHSAAPLH